MYTQQLQTAAEIAVTTLVVIMQTGNSEHARVAACRLVLQMAAKETDAGETTAKPEAPAAGPIDRKSDSGAASPGSSLLSCAASRPSPVIQPRALPILRHSGRPESGRPVEQRPAPPLETLPAVSTDDPLLEGLDAPGASGQDREDTTFPAQRSRKDAGNARSTLSARPRKGPGPRLPQKRLARR